MHFIKKNAIAEIEVMKRGRAPFFSMQLSVPAQDHFHEIASRIVHGAKTRLTRVQNPPHDLPHEKRRPYLHGHTKSEFSPRLHNAEDFIKKRLAL